jgi:hypothetical protein
VIKDILQIIILTLLSFCMFYGLGFIINMLLKTTWFPIYGYVAFVIVLIYTSWGTQTLMENIKGYTLADYIPLLSGLCGAILSGYTIKFLRVKGYKMF